MLRLLPQGLAAVELDELGRYGFAQGVPIQIERLINQYVPLVGFGKVAENDQIDATDAARVVAIQRWLFERFSCDASARTAALSNLDHELELAQLDADEEIGIHITAEMMWLSDRAGVVLDRLPRLHGQIVSGAMTPCRSLFSGRTVLALGAVFVGAYFLFGGHR